MYAVWERGILGERKCVFFPFHAINVSRALKTSVDYRIFSRHTKISPPENDLAWSLKCFMGRAMKRPAARKRPAAAAEPYGVLFSQAFLVAPDRNTFVQKVRDLMSSCVAGRHTEISMQVGERNTAAGCWQFLLPNPMYLLLRVCLARKCGFLTCHQDFVDSGPWLFQARTIWQSIWVPWIHCRNLRWERGCGRTSSGSSAWWSTWPKSMVRSVLRRRVLNVYIRFRFVLSWPSRSCLLHSCVAKVNARHSRNY